MSETYQITPEKENHLRRDFPHQKWKRAEPTADPGEAESALRKDRGGGVQGIPPNLRHLFARSFYRACRDVAKPADMLGRISIGTPRIYLASTEGKGWIIQRSFQGQKGKSEGKFPLWLLVRKKSDSFLAFPAPVCYTKCDLYGFFFQREDEPNMVSIFMQRFRQKWIKGVVKDLAPACFILFAGCFMFFFFEPLLAYATNMDDFWFDFELMIWPAFGMFAGFLLLGFLVLLIVYFGNLLFSDKLFVFKGIVLAGFIGFFLLYLQGNWLSGNLPGITGDDIIWENYGKVENLVLLSVFILLGIMIVVGIRLIKLDKVIHYAAMGSFVIFIMLFASLISTLITNDTFKKKDFFTITTNNFNTVSTNRNFMIFLVDAVDSRTFYNVMENDDDFRRILEDFTYYPDTLTVGSNTKYSVPHILTGIISRNETKYFDYCVKAYKQSPFLKKLDEQGYSINLYSNSIPLEMPWEFPMETFVSIDETDIKINFIQFLKQELKYVSFKYFPYPLKKYSQYQYIAFDTCRVDSIENLFRWEDWAIYNEIRGRKILDTQNENYFQFIHCEGAHAPYDTDKYINKVKGGSYNDKIAASLTIIKEYLQRLKDNDAYDNSVIVIMADHGYDPEREKKYEEPNIVLSCCNPILFIKGINEKHEMRESTQPISYSDLQDAFCDLIDGKQSDELFTDLESDRTRFVMWQKVLREKHIVEYATKGKAYELEKFFPTGNIYDLKD